MTTTNIIPRLATRYSSYSIYILYVPMLTPTYYTSRAAHQEGCELIYTV